MFQLNFTIIHQETHKIKQTYIWNPMTMGRDNYVNIDLCHQYFCCWGADVTSDETSLAARSKERRLFLHSVEANVYTVF